MRPRFGGALALTGAIRAGYHLEDGRLAIVELCAYHVTSRSWCAFGSVKGAALDAGSSSCSRIERPVLSESRVRF